MTPYLAEVHQTHLMRRQSWQARAVPDTGIDLKRLRPGFRWVEKPAPPLPVVQDAPAFLAVEPPSNHSHHFIVKFIIRSVAARYGVRVLDITSANREWRNVRPRHVAIYLAKKITQRSLSWVGRQFGGRGHATVLHAVRKVGREASEDFVFAADLAVLECFIRKGTA